jgi:predicted alpha-1,2-mannosidase
MPMPMPRIVLLLCFVVTLGGCADEEPGEYPGGPIAAVDVFVGTGGDGFGVGSSLPGAGMPYGMVKLSPDTSSPNGAQMQWSHCGGYAYDDPKIVGFSHTHMHGIGVPGYGSVLFMPSVGFDPAGIEDNGFREVYDKDSEVGLPGYYGVTLGESGIAVELTAGHRTGVHHWTWPEGTGSGGGGPADGAVLNIDLAYAIGGGKGLAGAVEVMALERRVRGWTHTDSDHGGDFVVYFDAVFDHDVTGYGTWADGVVSESVATAESTAVGAWLVFDVSEDLSVLAQVGISYTGPEGAAANREAEAVTSFATARVRAQRAWQERLGRVEVRGGAADQQRIFYSALYHVYQHPTLVTDTDGSYRGFDDAVHNDGRPYYTDFSLWDTYRTLHPLLILLEPAESADMAQSLVRMAEQWGGLPRWPLATSDSGSMIGTSADVVLAGSYLKGADNFDVERAWEFMWDHAREPVCCGSRSGVEEYLTLGYVAADLTGGSVSKTQEYAWDDWALSNLATALGKDLEATTLWDQSRTIGALWDPSVGFFRGRLTDGSWDPSFESTAWEEYFTEGDAWQHLWLSPHSELLTEIMGGRQNMLSTLEEFFELTLEDWENSSMGLWAMLPYYWHGNEPDIHAAYLFAAEGRPHLTQKWVRWIMDSFYDLGPKGLAGNDDAGTLSAWYVFSSLGFYPWAGSDRYYVGTPAFERATLHLPGGDFVVRATGLDQGFYVQSVTLNGADLDVPWFSHADLAAGGTLSFVLGAEPSDWGSQD